MKEQSKVLNIIFILAFVLMCGTFYLAYGAPPEIKPVKTVEQLTTEKNNLSAQVFQLKSQLAYLKDRFNKELVGYVNETQRLEQSIQRGMKMITDINTQIEALKVEVKDEKENQD